MSGVDFRTNPQNVDELSFYIFDNLRCTQDHEGGNVYRYDTVQEAAALFQYLQTEHPSWTIALGGSIKGTKELDFIQRREGENSLVTDFRGMDYWKDSPDVMSAISEAMLHLKVEWQVDHELTNCSILVPHDFDEPPLNNYYADLSLSPADSSKPSTSISEAYVEGKGWLSLNDLHQLTKNVGYENPEHPKVSRFNVAYRATDGRYGFTDIAPSDLRLMMHNYREPTQEIEVTEMKTMEGWHLFAEQTQDHAFDSYVKAGDMVGQDMVDHFLNILPPALMRESLLQIGTAYDSQVDQSGNLRPTFGTFAKEYGAWHFCGYCFYGMQTEPVRSGAAKDTWSTMLDEAKEKAAAKNIGRPGRQRSESRSPEH